MDWILLDFIDTLPPKLTSSKKYDYIKIF